MDLGLMAEITRWRFPLFAALTPAWLAGGKSDHQRMPLKHTTGFFLPK
jgi:hypothetical protein